MKGHTWVGCIAFALMLAVIAPARAEAPPDIREYYRQALARMVRLPQPALVTYTATIFATGQTFYVSRDPSTSDAEFGFAIGDALGENTASWPVRVRTSDAVTSITLEDGNDAVTVYPIFDATWNGAYRWLRYGFGGGGPPPSVAAAPSASPDEAPSSSPEALGVIAVVQSIGTSSYGVQDWGDGKCETGALGRRIHLIAQREPDAHPATDVTIDVATGDICTIRFELRRTQFFNLTGSVELHYARVGDYLLASDGFMRLNSDIAGIGRRRVDISILYSDERASGAQPTE